MGVFLRVFDPKGFRNPYKGSNWREVGRQRVEPVEGVRPHRTRTELQPVTTEAPPAETQARVIPPAPDEEKRENQEKDEEVNPDETTLKKAKKPSTLEKEITNKRDFYGPGELTGIAADLMNKDFPTVKSTHSVLDVSKALKKHKFSHLPVVTEKNTICGLITEKQIFRQLVEGDATSEELSEIEVKNMMISPVLCCAMETPIAILIQTILTEKVGFLPVVDSKDHFQGVVTKSGLLRYIFESPHFIHNPDIS